MVSPPTLLPLTPLPPHPHPSLPTDFDNLASYCLIKSCMRALPVLLVPILVPRGRPSDTAEEMGAGRAVTTGGGDCGGGGNGGGGDPKLRAEPASDSLTFLEEVDASFMPDDHESEEALREAEIEAEIEAKGRSCSGSGSGGNGRGSGHGHGNGGGVEMSTTTRSLSV